MISGVAWKDMASSSVGGMGPYVPRILLGKVDSEEEREVRNRSYRERCQEEQVQNALSVVRMLRKEGIISAVVAEELRGRVHDEKGIFCALCFFLSFFLSFFFPCCLFYFLFFHLVGD